MSHDGHYDQQITENRGDDDAAHDCRFDEQNKRVPGMIIGFSGAALIVHGGVIVHWGGVGACFHKFVIWQDF